jgi:hypothetical protein
MKKKTYGVGMLALAMVLAGPAVAGRNGGVSPAAPVPGPMAPILPGTGWTIFFWGLAALPGDAAPTFEFDGPAKVTVVDAHCTGDRFRIYDNNVLVLTTSPAQPPVCEFPGETSDPDTALTLPQFYTQGVLFVGPGSHSIRIEVIESYFEEGSFGGGAFIRIDVAAAAAIPFASPVGLALLMVALAVGGALLVRQRLVG